jgi:glycine/D-amino acid oxidase-like deaminating enzyme
MRLPLGHVCYFATPPGDERFTFPNLPSWNVPGVTGWPALPFDSRGFRVRGSIAAPMPEDAAPPPPPPPPDPELQARQQDPDRSDRHTDEERIAGSRRVLARRFPLLADAPLLETRSCHYQISNNRNFIVDRVPETTNAWIVGGGQAEGFKFGPVIGEYIATRVLGGTTDPAIDAAFVLPSDERREREGLDNLEELQ